jgi:hypothetical protein
MAGVSLSREELLARRLAAHGLAGTRFRTAAEVVARLGAVQAQDLPGAVWAIAQRTASPSASEVQDALDRGDLLRTHALRPTWHIIGRDDITWIQWATGARVEQAAGSLYRQYALDEAEFARSDRVLGDTLRQEGSCTRPELTRALHDAGIDTADPVRVQHLLLHAEVTGLIVSGPARGGKQTYALLAQRIGGVVGMPTDLLAELTRRYFAGHGPATSRDLAWWAGLTLTGARAAVEAIADELLRERFGDDDVWSVPGVEAEEGDEVLLLSNYDEFVVGYADRTPLFGEIVMADNPVFRNVITVRGTIVGTWSPKADDLAPEVFAPVAGHERRSLDAAVERYRAYAATPRA